MKSDCLFALLEKMLSLYCSVMARDGVTVNGPGVPRSRRASKVSSILAGPPIQAGVGTGARGCRRRLQLGQVPFWRKPQIVVFNNVPRSERTLQCLLSDRS